MPALRRPLLAIDPNSRPNKESTPYKENFCAILKDRLVKHWPHLLDDDKTEKDLENLAIAIRHEWDDISQETIDNTIRSVEKRVAAVINAEVLVHAVLESKHHGLIYINR
ncbi:hypothetical protein RBB50_007936 [Rhinocladiella similis]